MWIQPCTATHESYNKNQQPDNSKTLLLEVPQLSSIHIKELNIKKRQKQDIDTRQIAHPLGTLHPGDKVLLSVEETMVTIQSDAGTMSVPR